MPSDIKSMQLYPRADRINRDLAALGHGPGDPVSVEVLNRFDQLHYHGVTALDAAIAACGITAADRVLEVGSGWGGCARYIAWRTGTTVTAVELQQDYDAVARDLTGRAGLADQVAHVNADFLTLDLEAGSFDHVVSWLALFHIPHRADYLARIADALRPGAMFFAEDLYAKAAPQDAEDFRQDLFPNSLVPLEDYRETLKHAGFEIESWEDMTADWTGFTAERLQAFRGARSSYEAIHGAQGYTTIETFYAKMAGYFADGSVGGLRFAARLAR